jgi:hypothetical protein
MRELQTFYFAKPASAGEERSYGSSSFETQPFGLLLRMRNLVISIG